MGRQIHFYMLEEDRDNFLRVVQDRTGVVVAVRDSDSAAISAATDLGPDSAATLCLWNKSLLPNLDRKWIPGPGYYRVDGLNEPVLEFMPSFKAMWEGKPALGQGRLFGNFEAYLGKPEEFREWYETLISWIRKHYQKSPASAGGYVGPSAHEFYKHGGYLLPNFLPPTTEEWIAEIGKQHALSETT